MLLTSSKHDVRTALSALAAGTVAWRSIAIVAVLLTVWTAMGVLAEWQARRTLVSLVRTAPAGVITIRQDGSWGRVFQLAWGDDLDERRRPSRT